MTGFSKTRFIKPHTKFKAETYVLTKEEGGRHTPFFGNYRPQFYFRTTDVTGTVELPSGTEMVMPGDIGLTVNLISPIAMNKRLKVCYQRRRKNCWRWCCIRDHRVDISKVELVAEHQNIRIRLKSFWQSPR